MESIQDLTLEIQKRISDFEYFLCKVGMKRSNYHVHSCKNA